MGPSALWRVSEESNAGFVVGGLRWGACLCVVVTVPPTVSPVNSISRVVSRREFLRRPTICQMRESITHARCFVYVVTGQDGQVSKPRHLGSV